MANFDAAMFSLSLQVNPRNYVRLRPPGQMCLRQRGNRCDQRNSI
jgi:hypothetical protein